MGRTVLDLCTVAVLLGYLTVRGSQPGPLFLFEDGQFLTRGRFVDVVQTTLSSARVDQQKYCSHSFCIGTATTAAARGIEDSVIKTLGRWESVAHLQYVRMPREQLFGVSSQLAVEKFCIIAIPLIQCTYPVLFLVLYASKCASDNSQTGLFFE